MNTQLERGGTCIPISEMYLELQKILNLVIKVQWRRLVCITGCIIMFYFCRSDFINMPHLSSMLSEQPSEQPWDIRSLLMFHLSLRSKWSFAWKTFTADRRWRRRKKREKGNLSAQYYISNTNSPHSLPHRTDLYSIFNLILGSLEEEVPRNI